MAMDDSEGAIPAVGRAPLRSLFLAVQAAHHARGKHIGFIFCVGPENIVTHLMVNQIDPTPGAIVLAAFLPILGVNQIDLTGLVGLSRGFAPIDILKPFYFWLFQVVKPAK